jgi:hypothetical protein
MVLGIVRLRTDPAEVGRWIVEDGPVEQATHLALLACAGVSAVRAVVFRGRPDGGPASFTWTVLAAAFFFGAMEEISWGQRIVGWSTPSWLLDQNRLIHNRQLETTIHNLMIGGFSLNRWIFSRGLGAVLAAHLLLVPLLRTRGAAARAWLDRHAVPVAQPYQVAFLLIALAGVRASLRHNDRLSEFLEFAGSAAYLMIVAHPWNALSFPVPEQRRP